MVSFQSQKNSEWKMNDNIGEVRHMQTLWYFEVETFLKTFCLSDAAKKYDVKDGAIVIEMSKVNILR